jgi:hypothetical protein
MKWMVRVVCVCLSSRLSQTIIVDRFDQLHPPVHFFRSLHLQPFNAMDMTNIVESLPLPPHTHLYAHVLGCIFGFLTFVELHAVMRTSRTWLAVVCAMPPLATGKRVYDSKHMPRIISSRLVRHVIALELGSSVAHPESLITWVHGLPCLRILSFRTAVSDSWANTFSTMHWPRSLQEITIDFFAYSLAINMSAQSMAAINHAILAVSQLPKLHTLNINTTIQPCVNSDISFAPLSSACSLTHLSINAGLYHLSPDHLSQLRNLQISCVKVTPCSHEEFTQLLASGPPLTWTELINDQIRFDDTLAALIPVALPCMELVHLNNHDLLRLRSLSFLPQMASLRRLIIDASKCGDNRRRHIARMLTSMSATLPVLKHVQLYRLRFHTDQLQQWLTLTPSLEQLDLVRIHVTSSAFLSSVRTTIRSVNLYQCRALDAQELLVQLQELSHLTKLSLCGSLTYASTGHDLTTLTLPSDLLPTLTTFHYKSEVYEVAARFDQSRAEDDLDKEK